MSGSSSSVGFRGVTLVTGGGAANWVDLNDTPASITALEFVRGNAGGTALEFVSASSAITLQNAYDASTGGATPEITLDATRGALTIRGIAGQDLLDLQDAAGNQVARFSDIAEYKLQIGVGADLIGGGAANNVLFVGPDTASGRVLIEGSSQADMILTDTGGVVNEKAFQAVNVGGDFILRSLTDVGAVAEEFMQFDLSSGDISIGQSARRWGRYEQIDATGRFGFELFPDDFTVTTATGTNFSGFYTQAGRTITLNIPGGGGIGNETAPSGMNFTHTVRFEDTGFLFASQLLINAAVRVECATNTVGPLYLFLDQYNTYADGGARTCTQHNAMRAQPSWGPNINGGSIVQSSAQLYFAAMTVNGTVGSATVTDVDYFVANSPTLTAGGTIGTLDVLDIRNITGPTTIRGINSAMANGTFINHTGVAVSAFAGDIHMNNGVSMVLGTAAGNRIELLRSAAGVMRMIGVGGTNNEGLDWDFDTVTADSVAVNSSTGAALGFNLPHFAIGTTPGDPTSNNQFLLAPGAKTITLGGDFGRALFTVGANATVNAALTNGFSWIVNDPGLTIGSGSVVNAGVMLLQGSVNFGTNRCGLLITSNPTGGTLNHALRVTLGSSRFDGRVDINNGIALGGGAAATLGTIGGSGPTAAAQAQWCEIDIGGTPHWIPVWT